LANPTAEPTMKLKISKPIIQDLALLENGDNNDEIN
jgi:hypothetical protein